MAVDKRVNYSMQGHKKPARNYLGKQKTVKNIPIKWKSGPKAPETELAYITKAEKNLIIKKDLHGSLKHGPNTGPDGIMSLDTQGDYTPDRSPSGPQGGGGSRQSRDRNEQHMREILTGQKNIGQTAAVSDKVREGAVPEWVNTPDGRKYVGSAYKDTGKRGFFSRLFSGANRYGYAPVKGLRNIQTRGVPGQRGFEYFSEDEDVGDIQPGYGGRILGGLSGLLTGIPFVGGAVGSAIDKGKGIFGKKPRDMSQFNKLSLTPLNEQKISLQNDVPMESLAMYNMGNNQANANITGTNNLVGTDYNLPTEATDYLSRRGINFNQGGRIGYAYGTSDPEEPAEDIYKFMRDQDIPYGEQVEGEGDILSMLIAKYIEAGFPPDQAEEMAMQELQQMSQGSEQDQGIASLV